MREGWKRVYLGDVCETRLGKTLPRGSGADANGFPYLRNVNVQWGNIQTNALNWMHFSEKEREQLSLRARDILVCEGGEVGRLAVVPEDMDGIYYQNALHRVRVDESLAEPEYVAFSLEHLVRGGGLDGLKTQVTIAHLNQSKLRNVPLALPPLEEQRRIVNLIGALDETIVAAKETRSTLSNLLGARRDAAFSRGPYKLARDVFDILIGLQRSPSRADGPYQVPYLRSANVTNGQLVLEDVKTMSFTPQQQAKYQLRDGDVLVSEGSASENAVGAPSEFHGELSGIVCFQNTLLRYRALNGMSTPAFVSHWCSWAYESGAFRESANGTNIKHIGSRGAEKMLVVDVPVEDQNELAAELDAAQEGVRAADASVSELRAVRAHLLSALLSGEHEIPESYDDVMDAVT